MPPPFAAASQERVWYFVWYSIGLVIAAMIVGFAGLLLTLVLKLGGMSRESVVSYSVPKAAILDEQYPARKPIGGESGDSATPKEPTDRMLAAIVLHGSQAWFFKVTGPLEAVAKQADEISAFFETIHFAGADSPPQWKLPEGWEQVPVKDASFGRFASLQISTQGDPLELSVSMLTKGEIDDSSYLLENVNRWRGLLSLPRVAVRDLPKQLQELKIGDATAYKVDLSGRATSGPTGGGMGTAPFASGNQPPSSTNAPRPRENAGSLPLTGAPRITYKAPENWKEVPPSGMRKASFSVREGEDKSLDILITDLKAAANPLLANINRWRGEVKLKNTTQQELAEQAREIEVGGVKGHYVELFGPAGEATLGVVVYVDDTAWFIKLRGDAELARREKQNFEAFVRSIQFQK